MSWVSWLTKAVDLFRKGQTVGLKHELLNAREENHRLREQIRELEGKNVLQPKLETENAERLEFGDGVYWREREDCDDLDGPFCQVCYDDEKKVVRLQDRDDQWECLVCDSVYPIPLADDDPSY